MPLALDPDLQIDPTLEDNPYNISALSNVSSIPNYGMIQNSDDDPLPEADPIDPAQAAGFTPAASTTPYTPPSSLQEAQGRQSKVYAAIAHASGLPQNNSSRAARAAFEAHAQVARQFADMQVKQVLTAQRQPAAAVSSSGNPFDISQLQQFNQAGFPVKSITVPGPGGAKVNLEQVDPRSQYSSDLKLLFGTDNTGEIKAGDRGQLKGDPEKHVFELPGTGGETKTLIIPESDYQNVYIKGHNNLYAPPASINSPQLPSVVGPQLAGLQVPGNSVARAVNTSALNPSNLNSALDKAAYTQQPVSPDEIAAAAQVEDAARVNRALANTATKAAQQDALYGKPEDNAVDNGKPSASLGMNIARQISALDKERASRATDLKNSLKGNPLNALLTGGGDVETTPDDPAGEIGLDLRRIDAKKQALSNPDNWEQIDPKDPSKGWRPKPQAAWAIGRIPTGIVTAKATDYVAQ